MAAKCEQLHIKRQPYLSAPPYDEGYNLGKKKLKLTTPVDQEEVQQKTVVSNELGFPHRSQEELEKIFRPRKHRDHKLTFDSKESEESKEEEGLSMEELQKTKGWKLLNDCFNKMASAQASIPTI